MLVDEFEFELPQELIAQTPPAERDASRLMVLDAGTGAIEHRLFRDITEYLRPGDVLVVNDTRVYPARLTGVKEQGGGKAEALLVREHGGGLFTALMKGRLKAGARVTFAEGLSAVVEKDLGGGMKRIRFADAPGLADALERVGRMPLPPYIDQSAREEAEDRERYQTVYARAKGAVAAPTAGLHFTPELLARIKDMGVEVASVTLHVGIGTFMPVRVDTVEEHRMHSEEYEVTPDAADAVNRAKADGGRVVAVGTTSARTLESATDDAGRLMPGASATEIFIYPGYRFRSVDALITNFHLPRSTLLMLVSAFAGRQRTLAAYREAVREGYRFYSYGDAMFIHGGGL